MKRLSKLAAAISLKAEKDSVYYYQATVDARNHDRPDVWMTPVDQAEAKILISSSAFSNSRRKD